MSNFIHQIFRKVQRLHIIFLSWFYSYRARIYRCQYWRWRWGTLTHLVITFVEELSQTDAWEGYTTITRCYWSSVIRGKKIKRVMGLVELKWSFCWLRQEDLVCCVVKLFIQKVTQENSKGIGLENNVLDKLNMSE